MDVGFVVDHGLDTFRIQRAFCRYDPLRLAAAVPKAVLSVEVTDVASAMPHMQMRRAEKRLVADFRNRIGIDARDVFWRDLWSTNDDLSDFADWQFFGFLNRVDRAIGDADYTPFD